MDAGIVLALCVPLVVSECMVEHAVAYLLAAVAAGCVTLMDAPKAVNAASVILLTAGCALLPGMHSLVPFTACICMCQQERLLRFLWLLPLVVAIASAGWHIAAAEVGLCAIACVLAVRTVRGEAESKGMKAIRDGLREQAIGLADANRRLEEELAALPADARCEAGANARSGDEDAYAFNASAFADLTDREQAVVGLIAEGYDNREIAGSLYLSEGTVRNHISSILQKKHLRDRTQIAIMYYRG